MHYRQEHAAICYVGAVLDPHLQRGPPSDTGIHLAWQKHHPQTRMPVSADASLPKLCFFHQNMPLADCNLELTVNSAGKCLECESGWR